MKNNLLRLLVKKNRYVFIRDIKYHAIDSKTIPSEIISRRCDANSEQFE